MCPFQAKGAVNRADGQFQVALGYYHGNLDFRCLDHLDVDGFGRQRIEHARRNAGM
jgi:hypothetical protein